MPAYIIETGADLLDAAASEIEIHGWCQKTMENSEGNLCIIGGILSALQITNSAPSNKHQKNCIDEAGGAFLLACGNNASWWNDHICTSEFEAIDMLRQIAKKYREDHS